MNHLKLTAERLARKAIIYIRQSKPNQMLHHQESKRLQYGLDLSRFLRQPVKTQFFAKWRIVSWDCFDERSRVT
jgi:hypothetical protein